MSAWDSETPYDPDSPVGRRIATELTDILIDLTANVVRRRALAANAVQAAAGLADADSGRAA